MLDIFVCENFSPDFDLALAQEGFDDVHIIPYGCMCENKKAVPAVAQLLAQSKSGGNDIYVLCSHHCDIVKLAKKIDPAITVRRTNYCFDHAVSEGIIDYVVGKGGYVIGSGWLNNWESRIREQGFDRDTAAAFYTGFCRELVFFGEAADAGAEAKLAALSEFLKMPYVIIPFDPERVKCLIRSVVYEWRLRKAKDEFGQSAARAQAQCAEYAAILDMIGKLSTYVSRRETIGKIREIFTMVLGAQTFRFSGTDVLDAEERAALAECDDDAVYKLNKEENKFCIRVSHYNKNYGVIHAGDFLFPQYIDKYLNFAIEIARICGLVLFNVEQYDRLVRSEEELQYLSFHDALTGLYNRTFVNSIMESSNTEKGLAVFSFDIDNLKYVNDAYGHFEGDKLIRGAAAVLKNCFRENDTLARMGGDEFVAILTENNIKDAKAIQKRIEKAIIEFNRNISEPHLTLSISMGYALKQDSGQTVESLMQKADSMMYADKQSKQKKV